MILDGQLEEDLDYTTRYAQDDRKFIKYKTFEEWENANIA